VAACAARQAVEAEVTALLSLHADKLTDDDRARLVRHGRLPEREIITAARCPRVHDRVGKGSERIRFSSTILPPYARRAKSLEVLIPILYLKGVSTGDLRRRWSHCSARTPADCRPQPSGGSKSGIAVSDSRFDLGVENPDACTAEMGTTARL
jgi:hypothetical protein